ncbi:MAG: molybdopterin-dependent oxidoreductase, partial [Planctomycetota bacterium]
RQWSGTAEATNGKCIIIIGAGVNHWYHNNLIYRAAINALMFCGCVGVNGGGLAHYVGQEKLAPMASWSNIAFAKDWQGGQRLQNAPSWHYVNTGQWKYEKHFTDYHTVPPNQPFAQGHTVDMNVKAVRNGWLPFYPQFNRSNFQIVKDAEAAGCKTDDEIIQWVVDQLKSGDLKFAIQDPDAEECWPRVWYIWRGNALMSSAKGHEYFLKHYLGTHTNAVGQPVAEGHTQEIEWRPEVIGKLDLVVDVNFRMDTSALYSDIVLPAATFYEKADLNSTDMHSFIHPLAPAVPPAWESKSDWQAFREVARVTAELAKKHLPGKIREIHAAPLAHDSPDEMAQPEIKDWALGECEAIPGKTMPHLRIVERDYENLYDRFCSLGPNIQNGPLGAHGVSYQAGDFYDQLKKTGPTHKIGDESYPSLFEEVDACNAVLLLAPETNGELAYRAYQMMEKRTGLKLADLAEHSRSARVNFKDLQAQPRRLLNSPCWSGLMRDENGSRSYAPFTYNVERLVPWRTLTGRQHFYLDHEGYLAFGEHLPTYKPRPAIVDFGDFEFSGSHDDVVQLNLLTPHGKWQIHSTYGDTERMMTLSRGNEPFWMNDRDAEAVGLADNDWVEVFNDHGVVVTRCVVSARIPRGECLIYHSPERTLAVPLSPLRNNRRAGGHNSLTRVRLKPSLMMGGYGQFTYHFNYWGPTGVNRDTHVYVRKLPKLMW